MSDHALSAAQPRPRLPAIPGVAIVLVALALVFAAISPNFLSTGNLSNILVQSVILLLLAMPMTLIIMTEGLDLSMGAVLTLASLVLALTVVSTQSLVLGLAGAVGVGLAFGFVNGWLVSSLRIPPFVATLGTLGVAQGLALIVSDGQSVVGIPRFLRQVYSGETAGIPNPILIGAAFYALFHVLLYHTKFGVYIRALGGNRDALTLAGVKWQRMLVAVYMLGGAMAGVAALLLTARINAGHPTAAIGMEFDAIAAVALGGTSFERGNGWIFGTLLGVLTVGVLRNGLNLMAVPSSAQVAATGALVIVALFLDGLRSRKP
ncbi:ABC transporter permease [Aquabacter spiritensis]|uniref:Monosaccharide ABC transporter membrane protein (CUT2 family) n=1 Tax=Aquabacter spiritensis TaxID=933073 RepID=A0A4R3LNI9_9HYPH|nr:ABC transporter permease [Aquabacter spiritensis]TCT02023.1 monosaccharide ABC transporter membrane protein (CUT2 family) [Aquabacter spiritensis]